MVRGLGLRQQEMGISGNTQKVSKFAYELEGMKGEKGLEDAAEKIWSQ